MYVNDTEKQLTNLSKKKTIKLNRPINDEELLELEIKYKEK